MEKSLVIVESPSKAKTIHKYLGKNYKVEASMGHIRDLPKSQLGIDIEKNFEPKYITIRGKGPIIEKLKKEAKNASKIYLATDPDREGEAISWHLANLLNIDVNDKCRIEFHEITKNAIQNAIKNPRKINMNLVDAQQARRILDRLVGYNISPLLWKKIKRGLSAGRVQSVATRLICDREKEIEEFKPEEYWSLSAFLYKEKKTQYFEAKFYGTKDGKIDLKNENDVNNIIKDLADDYIVDNVKTGTKKRNPSPPFITSTMQQEASKKLGFTAKKTMMIAQQLYEGVEIKGEGSLGLITYMRTDSTRISEEAKKAAYEYILQKYGKEYANPNTTYTKKGGNIQDAHEAIRPTYINLDPDQIKDSLKPDQYKLYKLIWSRFLASQMSQALYDTITMDIINKNYIFKASGSKLKFAGFMTVYIEEADTENIEEKTLPLLEKGDHLKLKVLKPEQHFTQPPARYTEATLIKELEEKGIGRPSTYAPIISTLLERGYVIKEKKNLKPTELGFIVTDVMKEFFPDIVDVKFTAEMEEQLDKIEEGIEKWCDVIDGFYNNFNDSLKVAEEQMKDIEIKDEVTDIKCEFCGRNMVIKYGRYGKFLACPGFPECKNTKPLYEETGIICPKCGGKIIVKKSKRGKTYYACENSSQCGTMFWDKPINETCPKCGNLLMEKYIKGNKVIKCSNCDYVK
ncbi:type I DNA topoisomerase [Thermoanaerobacterium thermosaccharolyticum]|uniref:DNA topoisomerase 1 n=2 Tax=Thermoanaerobacterium thermosaccharolyticum TaxID=1517 RepID=D9TN66_THETC|nr:type I DNA topoisomerase [Thermoanaerobacterium thermosaccharolyticum]ADL68976.1 DNA topoisomerase I [Thermoanaerobacterium thermosaccharolyticum DSM 571]AST58982.1 DNA topoisomerase I [Thermoanaerobacterium thermosaccharolyticum]KAA5807783.1 type I DNA topoisomerase [Thermoanaerobacterium thermosaccharolyticum]OXT07487.1 DNA topoisomerase I [Thermoanaerobacterium thermosaccharolyticum]PHO07777.1 DNA topoisomerase I [Thermoanaerobacterium thermosaccharolyticum]